MKSNAELYLDTPCVAEFAYWKFALLATLWNGIAKRIAKKKKKKKGGGGENDVFNNLMEIIYKQVFRTTIGF